MKTIFTIITFAFITTLYARYSLQTITYEVDVKKHKDDLFHVTVFINGLSSDNNIYNLPATVPGTYSNLNFGRFVTSFKAYDKDGKELQAQKISTNQWQIDNVETLAKLDYDVEDTFDSEIADGKVIPMAGSGINDNFIVMNTFAMLGYFEKLQSVPIKLKLDYSTDWTVGTSLILDENGYYTAENYDQLVDSPILIGELTTASTTVKDIKVGVYVYSPDTTINADKIMDAAVDILKSASDFIGYSPVTHYNFLMCFLDMQTLMDMGFAGEGALEHSYSSLFVFPVMGDFEDHMAHEFMHILTPLNLHSDVIQPFNFAVPTASQHTWLYEGVTEWASEIMVLRSGLISMDEYLKRMSDKLTLNDRFRKDLSLTELSKDVYDEVITMQFLNFYNKGAVVAEFLDIRLLELSGGKRGLREVYLELLDKYGKDKPFPEDDFFEIIVYMTYPEIEQFINDYIKGTKPLPVEEYMAMLGFKYIPERLSEDTRPSLGVEMGMNDKQQFTIIGMSEISAEAGLKAKDVPLKILGIEVSMTTAREIFGKLQSMKVGDLVDVVVQRGDKVVEVDVPLQQRMDKYTFEEMENLTTKQKMLREAWSKNL
jgi:predicted metalloprotease with PDZ domain